MKKTTYQKIWDNFEQYKEKGKEFKGSDELITLLKDDLEKGKQAYVKLAKVFKTGETNGDEADWCFYNYIKKEAEKNPSSYTFRDGKKVEINILNPYVTTHYSNGKAVEIIHPRWHLFISYFAYKDAIILKKDNIHEKTKISEKMGNIKCPSLNAWLNEIFEYKVE